ncbi:hypothetical protein FACS1894102_5710 [Spirochaetia bacterium]|nr:hypothetical protein FACS1894102_5710 [Spirochaetia bacterium]
MNSNNNRASENGVRLRTSIIAGISVFFVQYLFTKFCDSLITIFSEYAVYPLIAGIFLSGIAIFLTLSKESRTKIQKIIAIVCGILGGLMLIVGFTLAINMTHKVIFKTIINENNVDNTISVIIPEECDGLQLIISGKFENDFLIELEDAETYEKFDISGLIKASNDINNNGVSNFYKIKRGTFDITRQFYYGNKVVIKTLNTIDFSGNLQLKILSKKNKDIKK